MDWSLIGQNDNGCIDRSILYKKYWLIDAFIIILSVLASWQDTGCGLLLALQSNGLRQLEIFRPKAPAQNFRDFELYKYTVVRILWDQSETDQFNRRNLLFIRRERGTVQS